MSGPFKTRDAMRDGMRVLTASVRRLLHPAPRCEHRLYCFKRKDFFLLYSDFIEHSAHSWTNVAWAQKRGKSVFSEKRST